MVQGRDGWPGKAAVSDSTRGSPQRDQLKSAPEGVVGLSLPPSSLLLCPLPSTVGVHCTPTLPSLHSQVCCGGPSLCRVARSWSCRSGPCAPWLFLPHMPLPFRSEPGLFCVLSWRDCGSRLPPLSPWAIPRAEVRSVSGLLPVQLSPFAVFLGTQGRCRCPYDVAGK